MNDPKRQVLEFRLDEAEDKYQQTLRGISEAHKEATIAEKAVADARKELRDYLLSKQGGAA